VPRSQPKRVDDLAELLAKLPVSMAPACSQKDLIRKLREAVGRPGLDLVTEARRKGEIKILILSIFGDVHHVVQAIERGADGYLLNGAEAFEVSEAIEMVLAGGAPFRACMCAEDCRAR
jgi:DNA-binding NarL/FixJ family response regulator